MLFRSSELLWNRARHRNDPHTYVLFGLAVLGSFLCLALFQSSSDYALAAMAQRARHDIRLDLYRHLQTLDLSFFEERQTGDIMSVIVSDVDTLESFLTDSTTSIIRLTVTFLGIYGYLFFLEWRLALLLFAPLPFALFAVRHFVTRVQPRYRATRAAVGAIAGMVPAHRITTFRKAKRLKNFLAMLFLR